MIKNQSGQTIGAQMVDTTSGGPFAGSVLVYITKDDGAQVLGSVNAGAATSKGNGYYIYDPTDVETNADLVAFTFVGTGAVPQTVEVETISAAQAAAVSSATGVSSVVVSTLVKQALVEIRVLSATDEAAPEDLDYG